MSQLGAKASARSNKGNSLKVCVERDSEPGNVHELITKMVSYEKAIRKQSAVPGRFEMLTKSEREFLRADLVADYIRLAITRLADKPDRFDKAVREFCGKISEMQLPSIELMGTFLAAIEISSEEDCLRNVPGLEDALRRTVVDVLQLCVEILSERACATAAV